MNVVIGILILTLGRKLFWFFVALVGLVAGSRIAEAYLAPESFWTALLVGVAGGLVGALLALFFQKLAIGVAGFVAGGVVAAHFAARLSVDAPLPAYVVGGILGAVLLYLVFDWGLILLSSVAGATLIVQTLNRPPLQEMLFYMLLTAAGVFIQAQLLRGRAKPLP
ncbi:MAG: DUF4203 domain-containing protein [Desulfobacteraceae bacterium]|nr:MAG: DUF4203 domain-containing protein [Desulfobacteraceae bacterium]